MLKPLKDYNNEIPEWKRPYIRMYTEVLMVTYNDIMTYDEYKYALHKWLNDRDPYYRNKLLRHNDSISWLLNKAKSSICFRLLKLNSITVTDIKKTILAKFKSPKKFMKFYSNYMCEVERDYYGKRRNIKIE